MGVQKAELEITSSLSAEKIFKGLVLDVDIIIPKAAPEAYKNVEIKGDGGAGTIKNFTFQDGIPITTATVRIDAVDKQRYTFDYSVIDGDILFGFTEKIENHLVVGLMADGGWW